MACSRSYCIWPPRLMPSTPSGLPIVVHISLLFSFWGQPSNNALISDLSDMPSSHRFIDLFRSSFRPQDNSYPQNLAPIISYYPQTVLRSVITLTIHPIPATSTNFSCQLNNTLIACPPPSPPPTLPPICENPVACGVSERDPPAEPAEEGGADIPL